MPSIRQRLNRFCQVLTKDMPADCCTDMSNTNFATCCMKDIVIFNEEDCTELFRLPNYMLYTDHEQHIYMSDVLQSIIKSSQGLKNVLQSCLAFYLDEQMKNQVFLGMNPRETKFKLNFDSIQNSNNLSITLQKRNKQYCINPNQGPLQTVLSDVLHGFDNFGRPYIFPLDVESSQRVRQIQPKDQVQIMSKQKIRREKERTVEFALEKVQKWKQIKSHGYINDDGEQIQGLTQEMAAKVLGMSKKTLEDYSLQLRKAQERGFSVNDHLQQKMGIIRRFNKDFEQIDRLNNSQEPVNQKKIKLNTYLEDPIEEEQQQQQQQQIQGKPRYQEILEQNNHFSDKLKELGKALVTCCPQEAQPQITVNISFEAPNFSDNEEEKSVQNQEQVQSQQNNILPIGLLENQMSIEELQQSIQQQQQQYVENNQIMLQDTSFNNEMMQQQQQNPENQEFQQQQPLQFSQNNTLQFNEFKNNDTDNQIFNNFNNSMLSSSNIEFQHLPEGLGSSNTLDFNQEKSFNQEYFPSSNNNSFNF